MKKKYKASFDRWLIAEAALIETIRSMVRGSLSPETDYDTIDAIIDVLAATIIEEIAVYLTDQYEDAYNTAAGDLLPLIEMEENAALLRVWEEVAGETFDERVRAHLSELHDAVVTGEASVENAVETFLGRVNNIIQTDGVRVRGAASLDAATEAESAGYEAWSTWATMGDEKVRDTHNLLEGVTIPLGGWFEVPGDRAQHPGGFELAENNCGCRCWLIISYR